MSFVFGGHTKNESFKVCGEWQEMTRSNRHHIWSFNIGKYGWKAYKRGGFPCLCGEALHPVISDTDEEECNHFWETITDRHDYLHPPKCIKGCGYSMGPEERIKIGLIN